MKLERIFQTDHRVLGLIQQSQYFQKLDRHIKQSLPTNLTPHFRVVCIHDGALIIHASTGMVASRLKMLMPAILPNIQQANPHIQQLRVLVRPINPETTPPKKHQFSAQTLAQFAHTAEQVRHHAPLHQALCQLVQRHRKSSSM